MLSKIALAMADVRLNPFSGAYAWLLHRISGLALTVYLLLHVWTLSAALDGRAALDARLALFRDPRLAWLEVLVLGAAAFHLLNGLRVIAVELGGFGPRQRALFAWVAVGTFAMTAACAWITVAHVTGG
jgi:succinate dehydrogenase / fumarate reductase cytochrome b subunit